MTEGINMSEYLQDTANQTPGSILRRARETSRLSKTEVAQQLHLTVDTVDRIEADDYEKLPAVIFVRGYVRAYAKLLKLSPDEVVAEFEKIGRTDTPSEFSTQKIYGERATLNEKILWVALAGIVSLLVIAVIWWQYEANTENHKTVVVETPVNQTKVITAPKPVQTPVDQQGIASKNLINDILQMPQARTPVLSNKSTSTDHQLINSDETPGQKLEDVQPELTTPF